MNGLLHVNSSELCTAAFIKDSKRNTMIIVMRFKVCLKLLTQLFESYVMLVCFSMGWGTSLHRFILCFLILLLLPQQIFVHLRLKQTLMKKRAFCNLVFTIYNCINSRCCSIQYTKVFDFGRTNLFKKS